MCGICALKLDLQTKKQVAIVCWHLWLTTCSVCLVCVETAPLSQRQATVSSGMESDTKSREAFSWWYRQIPAIQHYYIHPIGDSCWYNCWSPRERYIKLKMLTCRVSIYCILDLRVGTANGQWQRAWFGFAAPLSSDHRGFRRTRSFSFHFIFISFHFGFAWREREREVIERNALTNCQWVTTMVRILEV